MSTLRFSDKIFQCILKYFVWFHSGVERRFFYYLCKFFGKSHPKNNYDFRTRDFLSRLPPGTKVADLGCGTGKLAKRLAEVGCKVIAVDRNVPMVSSHENLQFFQFDLKQKELIELLKIQGVEVVVLSHILEHISDSIDLLRRLRAVPKILICVPCVENWKYQLKLSLGLDARTDPEHYREYSAETLKEELRASGWSLKEIFYNSQGELFASAESNL